MYFSFHLAVTIFILWAAGAFHIIDSGHIGVYKRGGALLNSWTDPGLHFMIPFLTKYHQVQITLQTDQVKDIPVEYLMIFSVEQAVVLLSILIKSKWSTN